MRRRALLAAFGSSAATSALAGCLESLTGSPKTNETRPTFQASGTANATTTGRGERTHADVGDPSVPGCEPSTPSYEPASAPPADAEFVVRDVSVSTSYDRPEKRYLLEPDAFYSKDAVDREREDSDEEIVVVDVEDVHGRAVREAIRTGIETGEWRSNELPYDLRETVERVDFFTGVSEDETYTHVGVALHEYAVDSPPAVEFGAAIADRYVSAGDPASLAFWVSNAREREWVVFAGTVPPFGMLRASRGDHGGSSAGNVERDEFLLWRDYEEEGCYDRRDDHWVVCAIGRLVELDPCQSVVREYAILPSDTDHYPNLTAPESAGTYVVSGEVSYQRRTSGSQSASLSWEVEFELEEI